MLTMSLLRGTVSLSVPRIYCDTMGIKDHVAQGRDNQIFLSSGSRDLSLTKGLGQTPFQDYRYSALPSSTSIRLIEWPHDLVPTTDLRLHLRTIDLATGDRPPYTALSYTWGADSGLEAENIEKLNDLFTNTVVCDGEHLRVTENAYTALSELRWRGRAHLFWVDAVCIDQSNVEERSQQVAFMGEIFAGAERTIVWLGEGDGKIREAHETVQEFNSGLSKVYRVQSGLTDNIQALLKGRPLRYLQLESNMNPPPNTTSLLELFARPWFQRLWVIQEVVLAKNLWILCGDMMFDWQALVDIAHDTRISRDLQSITDDPVVERGLSGLATVRLIAFLRGDISVFHRVVQSRFGATTGIGAFYAIAGTLIELFGNSQLSDSRDRVYAPLALARKMCRSQDLAILEPDYTQSVEEVFVTATHHFIRSSQSLDVVTMSTTPQRTSLMPSWVPDLRKRSAQKPITTLISCNATSSWHRDTLAQRTDSDVSHLPVSGRLFNTISRITPDLLSLLKEDEFSILLHFVHGSVECRQAPDKLPEILLNTLVCGAEYADNPLSIVHPSREQFVDWFSFKLLCSHFRDKLSAHDLGEILDHISGLDRSSFCSRHSTITIPRQSTSRTACIICNRKQSLSSITSEEIESLARANGNLSDLSFHALVRYANITCALIDAHHAGIDTLDILRSEWYSAYMFQTAYAPYITDRSLFLTSTANLGMCSKESREGDEIWFLVGAKVPVILRPLSDGHYEFVGEAYMGGYMNGEICQEYGVEELSDIILE